ncbi:MAG: sigma-70 family RNA polymerase sigma factor [Aggregatilineales bacterium]
MNRADELKLLKQAQNGDKEAFAMIYRENVQTIYRYVYHRVNNSQLAEDITGDVFIRALERLDKYRDTGVPFIAWLYRIAHGRVVDYYRRQDRRPTETALDAQPLPVESDMDAGMMMQDIAAILRSALDKLTDDQQEVIILRFIEAKPIAEVAMMMGKKANAIKALQHRALRALARQLERSGLDIETILAEL